MNLIPTTFGELLRAIINGMEKPVSLRDFAKSAKTSHGLILDVIKGRRRPPLKKMDDWATALGLTGMEREQFFLAARSARAKGKMDSAAYVTELETRVRTLERTLGSTTLLLREVIAFAAEGGRPIPERMLQVQRKLEQRFDRGVKPD